MLQALHPLFQLSEDAGTRDNAAGAVGRTLAVLGPQLPLEQVCPSPGSAARSTFALVYG